jgi:hypothetical protein
MIRNYLEYLCGQYLSVHRVILREFLSIYHSNNIREMCTYLTVQNKTTKTTVFICFFARGFCKLTQLNTLLYHFVQMCLITTTILTLPL